MKVQRGEVVSLTTGGRQAEPQGLQIKKPAAGGRGREAAGAPPRPRPLPHCLLGAHLGCVVGGT